MLVTPRLNIFNSAIDGNEIISIKFSATGGDQIYANEVEVYKVDTNVKVYTKKETTFQFNHDISANSLTNGFIYKVRIRTYNSTGRYSSWSDYIMLKCMSVPIVAIDNVLDGKVESQTYKFEGSYLQTENDGFQSYRYVLYDSFKNQIAISEEKFDGLLECEFTGLKNDTYYYVELKVKTNSNVETGSTLVGFYVKYITNKMKNAIGLTNDFNTGSVDIEINAIQVRFMPLTGDFSYTDDTWINLSNSVIYTDNTLGFYLNGDKWTLDMRFKVLNGDRVIFKAYGTESDYLSIEKWKDRLFIRYYKNDFMYMNKWISLTEVVESTIINLQLQKNGNGYSVATRYE